MRRGLKELHQDKRGAVLVEFLVALMPLMITFFGSLQLMQVATARVVVKHGAIVGARAAAVISNKNRNTPDQPNGSDADVEAGVKLAMGPWVKTMQSIDVRVDDQSSCDDPYGPVTVTVRAEYKCSVPFGNLICSGMRFDGFHWNRPNAYPIEQRFTFPHQGARYQEGGGASCN